MNVNCADPDEKSRSVFIDKTRNGPSVAASASVPEKGQSLPSASVGVLYIAMYGQTVTSFGKTVARVPCVAVASTGTCYY